VDRREGVDTRIVDGAPSHAEIARQRKPCVLVLDLAGVDAGLDEHHGNRAARAASGVRGPLPLATTSIIDRFCVVVP
jgi:hypothetical protein